MLDNTKPVASTYRYFFSLIPFQFQYTSPDSDDNEDEKVQEKESKSDEWFSSLQYLHCNINDLLITNSFLDSVSEFGEGNYKHISESLGWYTDVPISVKDKDGKIVTATGNFARINNGEPEPMLCLSMTWIRKVQDILDPNKNQFQMKLHGKTYTIPTFREVQKIT
ncbi:hypothetical protein C2G38_2238962 [Gigaspora rosea]|uniref:Uncharacterized protein n=1 Tax=Gigaspora rosea TaxID=44941 RepID=A0A397W6X1_9GLOM|nr:hypothetical protein C2G38_2238962 [Gigaspora rosea]